MQKGSDCVIAPYLKPAFRFCHFCAEELYNSLVLEKRPSKDLRLESCSIRTLLNDTRSTEWKKGQLIHTHTVLLYLYKEK